MPRSAGATGLHVLSREPPVGAWATLAQGVLMRLRVPAGATGELSPIARFVTAPRLLLGTRVAPRRPSQ